MARTTKTTTPETPNAEIPASPPVAAAKAKIVSITEAGAQQ
jgi:hypothetical protein